MSISRKLASRATCTYKACGVGGGEHLWKAHLVPNKSYPWEGHSVCRILLCHYRLERKKTWTSKSPYFIYNFVSYQFKTFFKVQSQQYSCKGNLKSVSHCVLQIYWTVGPELTEKRYWEKRKEMTLKGANTSGWFLCLLANCCLESKWRGAGSLLHQERNRLHGVGACASAPNIALRPTRFRLGCKHAHFSIIIALFFLPKVCSHTFFHQGQHHL